VCNFNYPIASPNDKLPTGGEVSVDWYKGTPGNLVKQDTIKQPFSFQWNQAVYTYTPSQCISLNDTNSAARAPINTGQKICYPNGTTERFEQKYSYLVELTFRDSCPTEVSVGFPLFNNKNAFIKPNAQLCIINNASLYYELPDGSQRPGTWYDVSVDLKGCCKLTHESNEKNRCVKKKCQGRAKPDPMTGKCKCVTGYFREATVPSTDKATACTRCASGETSNPAGDDCVCRTNYGLRDDGKPGCQKCGRSKRVDNSGFCV